MSPVEKHTFMHYVVVTKYGFVHDVYEEYGNEELVLENVGFTNDVSLAEIFRTKKSQAPKYARGVHWDASVEEWAKAIGGRLVEVFKITTFINEEKIENGRKFYVRGNLDEYHYEMDEFEQKGFEDYDYINE